MARLWNFTKMHGLGNDYVFTSIASAIKIENPSQLAVNISDRSIVCRLRWPDYDLPFFDSPISDADV
jgi:hypothetical protein